MTRDPKRIPKVLKILREVWEENPDWRLGQLIVNASTKVDCDHAVYQIFHMEEDQLVMGLKQLRKG